MKGLIVLLIIALLLLLPQVGWASVGNTSGIGAPLPPNRVGGDNFIRYIGDRLILDFHEGAGTTIRDLSGNGNNGTLGTGTSTPEWRGNSLYFDGVDDYARIPDDDSLDFSDRLTLEIQFNLVVESDDTFALLTKLDWGIEPPLGSWDFEIALRRIYVDLYGAGGVYENIFPARLLPNFLSSHSGVMLFDGITMSLYIDGENWVESTGFSGEIINNTPYDVYLADEPFDGPGGIPSNIIISFVRLGAIPLTSSQVLQEYLWNKWRN